MAAQDADFDWSNSWNLELFELFDPVTEQYFRTLTFRTGGFGTHGRNGTYVLSVVQQGMDEFLDEYLRVNETACSP